MIIIFNLIKTRTRGLADSQTGVFSVNFHAFFPRKNITMAIRRVLNKIRTLNERLLNIWNKLCSKQTIYKLLLEIFSFIAVPSYAFKLNS
jgi:hypothetical protein